MDFSTAMEKIEGFDFPIGESDSGELIYTNLKDINHLLVSGEAGTGKSVFVDSMILSLISNNTPEKLRLLIWDSTGVNYPYNGISHLLIPVITDSRKMVLVLQWAITEIQKRLRTLSETGTKSLGKYNDRAWENFSTEMPPIVIVLDDFSSLLDQEPIVKEYIDRILLNGRTAGIYLVAVTPNPTWKESKKISLSFRSRLVFCSSSAAESKILLGIKGAESLPAPGYAFFSTGGEKSLQVKTFIVSDDLRREIKEKVKSREAPQYNQEIMREIAKSDYAHGPYFEEESFAEPDELLPSAIEVVVETGMASVSMLQRRLKLGYSRAARLVDQMEEKGVVGPFEGSKPRQVLISKEQWQEMQYKASASAVLLVSGATPEESNCSGDFIQLSKETGDKNIDIDAKSNVEENESKLKRWFKNEMKLQKEYREKNVTSSKAGKVFLKIVTCFSVWLLSTYLLFVLFSFFLPEENGKIMLNGFAALLLLILPILLSYLSVHRKK